MQITSIQIRPTQDCGKLIGIAAVTFDNELAIHNIKIIKTDNKTFLGMPSHRNEKGLFSDFVHPISDVFRKYLTDAVIDKYLSVSLDSYC